jgi:hypothetical protein
LKEVTQAPARHGQEAAVARLAEEHLRDHQAEDSLSVIFSGRPRLPGASPPAGKSAQAAQ